MKNGFPEGKILLEAEPAPGHLGLALFDTLVFLLNEYFIELNTVNFYFLNKFLN